MQYTTEKNESAIEWLEALVFALGFMVILFTFFFRVVAVSGESMVPTLNHNDRLVMQSMFYTPGKGDVIVVDGFIAYGDPIVKRVIGTEGDTVNIDFASGTVTVNGIALDEPYVSAPTNGKGDMSFPLTVPEGMIFVLGDNRPFSLDSRDSRIGFIDNRDVLGKVLIRIYPFSDFGGVE